MISGFVILMTLEKTKRPLDFIVSRFSRLFPCYWVAIILTFTVVSIFHLHVTSYVPGSNPTLRQAIINMSMLQSWLGIERIDGVYWTLSTELLFYFIMFLLFITRQIKNIEIFGFIGLLIIFCSMRLSHFSMPQWVQAARLQTYGHLFFAGILFYKLKTKGNAWHRYLGLALCLLVQHMLHVAGGEEIVFLFFVVFYFFVSEKLAWIVNGPMVYLGTISYSLYLIHQNIGYVIINHLYESHANAILRFIVPTCCALLLATAITNGIEKPAMVYIINKFLI